MIISVVKKLPSFIPANEHIMINIKIANIASFSFIFLAAIGRYFFVGWSLSSSRSSQSFIIYVIPEILVNPKKAITRFSNEWAEFVKRRGKKTSRFLYHWSQRSNFRYVCTFPMSVFLHISCLKCKRLTCGACSEIIFYQSINLYYEAL